VIRDALGAVGGMKLAQTTARRIVLASRPRGRAALTDFGVEETDLPDPKSGEMLLRVEYLSLNPYMRGRMEDRAVVCSIGCHRRGHAGRKRRYCHRCGPVRAAINAQAS
jgi:hypothetical protein